MWKTAFYPLIFRSNLTHVNPTFLANILYFLRFPVTGSVYNEWNPKMWYQMIPEVTNWAELFEYDFSDRLSRFCNALANFDTYIRYETWKLKTLGVRMRTGTDGKQHPGCHGNHFWWRTYVATHRLHSLYLCTKYESWKLWELECGQERTENSILVAMATTLDDEGMSRHTASLWCTYVPSYLKIFC